MAQVFGLRSLGRSVDITHNWSSPYHPAAKGLDASKSITYIEYSSSTFKSYGASLAGFIQFAKKMFSTLSSIVIRAQEHMYFLRYC